LTDEFIPEMADMLYEVVESKTVATTNINTNARS